MEEKLKYEKPELIRLSRSKDKLGMGQACITGSGATGGCATGNSATGGGGCGIGNGPDNCLPGSGV